MVKVENALQTQGETFYDFSMIPAIILNETIEFSFYLRLLTSHYFVTLVFYIYKKSVFRDILPIS